MKIQVAYALPDKQTLIDLDVPAGTTAQKAVELSGMCKQFPELDPANLQLGIFSKIITPDHPLEAGDRVEIYRALLIDPKEARRERAERIRSKGKRTY